MDKPHQCFIAPIRARSDEKPQRFIFFDFESVIDPITGEHQVNLVCMVTTCDLCINILEGMDFECCGARYRLFFQNNALERFIDATFFNEENRDAILICHNTGR